MENKQEQSVTVKDIVEKFLQEQGKDGLYNPVGECGCPLTDVSPADCLSEHCLAACRRTCAACGDVFYTDQASGTLCPFCVEY